ncbi:putative flavonol 3-O-glucosyltransferase [Rosa chinensis]|uniref:Glycosyltransferase n=1 Tax=Rosa chinensis TaxID=74649 RepID=A0A2P6PM01_ROSCH|nr:UDP-glucose flavonoid 3-O-glucosyltransferase 7 [Rosa chinensis]PRQ22955.1 putative flavonol 3-O-glucosyltransferase [Rosa chinensis]
METKSHQPLQIFFFPYMGQGYTVPLINISKLFASHGVRTTIITTTLNAPLFSKPIQSSGFDIELLVIKFPCIEVGLPEGIERPNLATTLEMKEKFFKATTLLQPQIDKILDQHRPDCLVADTFFAWATDVAAKFSIPRLIFHGTSFFPMCASLNLLLYQPHKKVSSDSESFVIPNLPDKIKMTRNQLPVFFNQNVETEFTKLVKASIESEKKSYGVIVNSFYELESNYADHYRNVFGRKAWHIGPVSLFNKAAVDEENGCFHWLNFKKPSSVIYICFGSMTNFSDSQLLEIAVGLEASGQEFIWVVKKEKNEKEEWLPKGFEQRMEGKGVIIRGWAPQVAILEHEAIGGFVTHCGWNSILEAVSAGVPMITWPVSAEQFYNEKLVTQILGIGVVVGAQKWSTFEENSVKREAIVQSEAIEKALTRIMVGGEAEKIRSKANALGEMATRAVQVGGSSFSDLNALIEDLRSLRA